MTTEEKLIALFGKDYKTKIRKEFSKWKKSKSSES